MSDRQSYPHSPNTSTCLAHAEISTKLDEARLAEIKARTEQDEADAKFKAGCAALGGHAHVQY